MRNFSSAERRGGPFTRFLLLLLLITPTVRASRSHRDNVPWETPTSCDSALALIDSGPDMGATILALKPAESCDISTTPSRLRLVLNFPPHGGTRLRRAGRAQGRASSPGQTAARGCGSGFAWEGVSRIHRAAARLGSADTKVSSAVDSVLTPYREVGQVWITASTADPTRLDRRAAAFSPATRQLIGERLPPLRGRTSPAPSRRHRGHRHKNCRRQCDEAVSLTVWMP